MVTRIQLRRDTATNWATNNPTLALGEMGIETDTKKFKFGDGSTEWTSLEYVVPSNLSDFNNDAGFIDIDDVEDAGYARKEPVWNFTADYQTELDRVVNKVKGYQDDKSKFNVSFLIFTDTHADWENSHPELERMLQAVNYLTYHLDLQFVADLGDNMTKKTFEGAMDVYPRIFNYLKIANAPYVSVLGNHDYLPFTYRRNYATNSPFAKFDKYGDWYYIDDENHDLRYIFLDAQDRGNDAVEMTTLTTDATNVCDRTWLQLNWLANEALKTTKKVIIFEHQSLGCTEPNTVLVNKNDTTNYYLAKQIVRDFEKGISNSLTYTQIFPETKAKSTLDYDFTSQGKGRVLCVFNGHTHADLDWTYSGIQSYPTPFCEIWVDDALTNSAYGIGDDNPKTLNTVDEVAFDVVTIDLLTEKVYCTRFGTGPDRTLQLVEPEDDSYTELDYIASTGIQYIDTGYTFTKQNHKTQVTFSDAVIGSPTPSWICGSVSSGQPRCGLGIRASDDKITVGLGKHKASSTANIYAIDSPTVKTTVTLDVDESTHKFSFTGGSTDYTNEDFEDSGLGNSSDYIFGVHTTTGEYYKPSTMKLYGYKMWDGDVLVRDFIPVLNHNGVPCLYDKVQQVFHYNIGSGSFIPGYKEVTSHTLLEYIKSTGTQHIDTNLVFTDSSHKYEATLTNVLPGQEGGTSAWICGSVDAPDARSGGLAVQPQNNNKVAIAVGNSIKAGSTTYVVDAIDNTPVTLSVDADNSTKKVTYTDGTTTYTDVSYTGTILSGLSEILFAVNDSGIIRYHTCAELHELKVYEGGNLIRDFIPVKDNTNVVCLYDTVNKLYYRNTGEGNFVAGPEKNA